MVDVVLRHGCAADSTEPTLFEDHGLDIGRTNFPFGRTISRRTINRRYSNSLRVIFGTLTIVFTNLIAFYLSSCLVVFSDLVCISGGTRFVRCRFSLFVILRPLPGILANRFSVFNEILLSFSKHRLPILSVIFSSILARTCLAFRPATVRRRFMFLKICYQFCLAANIARLTHRFLGAAHARNDFRLVLDRSLDRGPKHSRHLYADFMAGRPQPLRVHTQGLWR